MWVGLYIPINFHDMNTPIAAGSGGTWLLLLMDGTIELSETWVDAFLLLVDA